MLLFVDFFLGGGARVDAVWGQFSMGEYEYTIEIYSLPCSISLGRDLVCIVIPIMYNTPCR